MKNYKIYAISYSDDNYSMSKKINLLTARIIGKANYAISFSVNDLDAGFTQENADILKETRGAGYWIWKPHIMLKTLHEMNYGDYLIYSDAGSIYVKRIEEMIRQIERDNQYIFLSSGFAPSKDWTKRDAFILMGCDCEEAYNSIMVSGGYILVKKCDEAIAFLQEWQEYLVDRRIVSDDLNRCGGDNIKGFIMHRHDQSVLSLLAWKKGIIPYKAVGDIDQPHAHRKAIESHLNEAYKYTANQRLELMYVEHQTSGYIASDYGRVFINTRLRNMPIRRFWVQFIKTIVNVIVDDRWGKRWNEYYLSLAKERINRRRKEI